MQYEIIGLEWAIMATRCFCSCYNMLYFTTTWQRAQYVCNNFKLWYKSKKQMLHFSEEVPLFC